MYIRCQCSTTWNPLTPFPLSVWQALQNDVEIAAHLTYTHIYSTSREKVSLLLESQHYILELVVRYRYCEVRKSASILPASDI